MASLLAAPYSTFFDANGIPLNGGLIYTYSAGTTTPKASYTDVTGLIPAGNPVVLDSAGRAAIWLDGTYKIVVKDSLNNTIYTQDNISSSSSSSTTAATAFRNLLINGDMNVAQRGTSFTGISGFSTPTYTLDRWFAWASGSASLSVSQQTGTGNFNKLMRVQRANGNSSTATLFAGQIIESVDCPPLASQTITISFYARSGANFSATGGLMNIRCQAGTGTDQGSTSYTNGSWSGAVLALNTTQAITSTLTRYSFTATIGSGFGEVAVDFGFAPTGTAGAADYIEITGYQLEIGSLTAFEQDPYAITLQRSQRYYWRQSSNGGTFHGFAMGVAASTTSVRGVIQNPVPMRNVPSSIESGGTISVFDGVTLTNSTVVALDVANTIQNEITITVASGLTQFRPYRIQANNDTTTYLAFNAEL